MSAPRGEDEGEEAELDSTLERAAELLGRARFPLFGGLFTDINGAAAALALAEKLGGVVDHAASTGLMRNARIMRERGASSASFGEVRNRADLIVMVGDKPLERDPGLIDQLFPKEKGLPRPGDHKRELVLLGGKPAGAPRDVPLTWVGLDGSDLPGLLARLGAAVGERRIGGEAPDERLAAVAARLRAAAFAVFVYSADDLDEPAIFTILDMVRHLSITTRAATFALPAPGNGDGVNLCATWTCGLPVRTSFAGVAPEHDARRFATSRLIESGEADALVWIDALVERSGHPPKGVPTVKLSSEGGAEEGADIVIEVACAGRDHDAALYLMPISGIGMVKAAKPDGAKPTVAAVLTRIGELIDAKEAA
jgi:formylmethanofuran dehydrogenase subunit B